MEKNGNESKPEAEDVNAKNKDGDGNLKSNPDSNERRPAAGGGSYMGTSNRPGRPHSPKPKGGGRRYPRKNFEKVRGAPAPLPDKDKTERTPDAPPAEPGNIQPPVEQQKTDAQPAIQEKTEQAQQRSDTSQQQPEQKNGKTNNDSHMRDKTAPSLNISELHNKKMEELAAMGRELGVEGIGALEKPELVFEILKSNAEKSDSCMGAAASRFFRTDSGSSDLQATTISPAPRTYISARPR